MARRRAGRDAQPVAVLLGDVDRFKSVNDTYGHQAGDVVLREAARRMCAEVRPYDAVGRYGGEEFLMVLPGCDGESALVQAERVREALCAMPFKACGHTLPVSCSIGVAFRSLPVPADAHTL
jgi:diguanylate cyclase (GGDEF)-like protein